MLIKSLISAVALTVGAITTAHGAIISSTSQGTINSYAYDGLGLFGQAGANLYGAAYSMTISFDRALNTDYSYANYDYSYNSGSAPATVSLTINNATYSTILGGNNYSYSQQFISNGRSTNNGNYPYDQLYAYAYEYSNGMELSAYQYVYSNTNAFVGAVRDVSGSYTRNVQSGDYGYASFYMYNYNLGQYTQLYTTPTSMSFNGAAVPEPETLALLAIGLFGIIGVRRRAMKKSAAHA